jgi:putative transposase
MLARAVVRTVESMAPLRIIDPLGMYHVMSRGNYRQAIYPTEHHYRTCLALLEATARKRRWIVLDWCLMPNHYHLIVQLTQGGLSEGMRWLNGGYSTWCNARADRTGTGHLFKNRFTAPLLDDEAHMLETFRYVPANPVRAGLAAAPEDWPWGGYRASVGSEHPRPFHRPGALLAHFATEPRLAVERYREFVHDGLIHSGHPAVIQSPA